MMTHKPYIAKVNGRDYKSTSPGAMCATVQMAERGEVAAQPGYEDSLATEIIMRAQNFPGTWTNIAPGQWTFEAQ
jgi:hypothetical protein